MGCRVESAEGGAACSYELEVQTDGDAGEERLERRGLQRNQGGGCFLLAWPTSVLNSHAAQTTIVRRNSVRYLYIAPVESGFMFYSLSAAATGEG